MAGLVGAAVLSGLVVATVSAAPLVSPPLHCTLTAPAQAMAGQPVRLQLSLRNSGEQAIDLLVWGTPFESAWFAPFVSVQRGGKPLVYGGAMIKRGEPGPEHYLRIEAGAERQTSFDLAAVFDLRTTGRYRVVPRIVLHDWLVAGQAAVPRPREQHVGSALACNAVGFVLTR